jgi:DNA invertase Pin-like site-specific DNA recombinase
MPTSKPEPVRVMGYSRVSTVKQDLSPEVQRKMAKDWYDMQVGLGAWPQGSEWLDMLFDQITSKVNLLERPQGQLITTLLSRGDVLVVARSDRAFRSAADCEIALSRLSEAGIRVVFLNMPVDTGTAEGMLMASVMAAFSRYEREAIRWRTKAALGRLREMGGVYNKPPGGWKIAKNSKGKKIFVPDNDYRRMATHVCRMLVESRNLEQTSLETWKYLKAWKRKTLIPKHTIRLMAYRLINDWPQTHHNKLYQECKGVPTSRLIELLKVKLNIKD